MCVFPLPQEYPRWSQTLSAPSVGPSPRQSSYGPAAIIILSEEAQAHLRAERRAKR